MALSVDIPGGTIQLSGNPIWVEVSGGSAPADSEDYKIMLRIADAGSNLMGAPFIDAIPPDGSGNATFDISGYMDQPIPIEWFGLNVGGPHDSQLFDITVEAGECYIDSDGVLQEDWSGSTEELKILKGGIGDRQLAYYNDQESSFYEDFVVGKKWLTWQPDGMIVPPYMPVKLWFVSETAGSSTRIVTAYYSDGTTDVHSEAFGIYDISGILEFNGDPYSLGMDLINDDGARIEYFTVELEGYAPLRTYYIDWTYHENYYYLFYANSLGGVDSIWLGGLVEEVITSNMVTTLKPAAIDATVYDPTVLVSSKSATRVWRANTGYKRRAELRDLRDMLLSKRVWFYFRGNIYPVVVRNTESVFWDETKDITNMTLELTEAHESRYF
jgi:hypothetical protein